MWQMNKNEFLLELRKAIASLPEADIEERISFYSEMIDDRIEEGMSEEAAVEAIGTIEEVAGQIIAETPLTKLAKERIRPKKRLGAWAIVLIVLGSPIWFSLIVAAASVVLSVYVSVWSIVVALWSAFAAFVGSAIGGIAAAVICLLSGHSISGLALLAAGIVLLGISIFTFFACKAATKGLAALTKKLAICVKRCFVKKEVA